MAATTSCLEPQRADADDMASESAASPTAVDLAQTVVSLLERYFIQLDGQKPAAIYPMVIASVEKPMLQCVLAHTRSNQLQAAEILGISRSTLRKKLKEYQLID